MILKPKDVLEKISYERNCGKNVVIIFFLNHKKEIISTNRHFISRKSQLTLGKIFIPAFYVSASFLIIIHIKNKPTTTTEQPTQHERKLTTKIAETGQFLNIQLLDHLLVTKKTYYSFHESGII